MPGVDGETFETLDRDRDYARDKSRVYYKGRVLRGADPKTFRLLTAEYGVDSNRVYWEDRLMDGVQPDRLQIFSWCASDGASWWFAGKRDEGRLCSKADATTFRAIDGDGIFGKDKSHVFYKSTLIEGADPGTFERVKGSSLFSKDAKAVYLGEKLIPGADPTSWRRLTEGGYSADASSIFWETKRLEGAVVKSFVPSQGNPNYYGWGYDGTSWWYYGQRRDDGPNE